MNDLSPMSVKREINIGIISAIVKPELISFDKEFESAGWKKIPKNEHSEALISTNITQFSKSIADLSVIISTGTLGGMGQARSAIETYAFLERVKPQVVILCGIAGSLSKTEYSLGDVVVGDTIYWGSRDKIEDGDPCRRLRSKPIQSPQLSPDIVSRLSYRVNYLFKDNHAFPAVHCGNIYSWDFVANGESVVREILSEVPKACCVEMEAGGFMGACKRFSDIHGERSTAPFVVRGISDYAEAKVSNDGIRLKAASNAARVAIKLAEDMYNPEGWDLMGDLSRLTKIKIW